MGRNSAGIRNSYAGRDKEVVTLAMTGITPKQIKLYGGKNELGGMIDYYNEQVKKKVEGYLLQVANGTLKQAVNDAPKQAAKLISYLESNKSYGDTGALSNTIKEKIKAYESGNFKRGILSIDNYWAKSELDALASMRAKRLMLKQLKQLLKEQQLS